MPISQCVTLHYGKQKWHMVNPTECDFSYLSARHKSFSRVDFIFASKNIFSNIISCSLLPMTITDHRAVFCTVSIDSTSAHAARWRLNTTLLKNENFKIQFEEKCTEFIQLNRESVNDPRILWDATNGFIRNNVIIFFQSKKR